MSREPSARRETTLDDHEMVELRESLDNNGNLSMETVETIDRLCVHLREYEKDMSEKEDYRSAKRARQQIESAKDELIKRERTPNRRRALNIEDGGSEIDTRWEAISDSFDRETENKRVVILRRQKQNLSRFSAHWNEKMPQKYRKPSARLLDLKQVERTLAANGEYDRAGVIHAEAERLSEKEQEIAQGKLMAHFRIAHEKMLFDQAGELNMFEDSRVEAKRLLEMKHQHDLAAVKRRNAVLQKKPQNATKPVHRSGTSFGSRTSGPSRLGSRKALIREILLPALVPPGDQSIVDEEKRKRNECVNRRNEFLKHKEQKRVARLEAVKSLGAAKQPESPSKRRDAHKAEPDEEAFVTVSPNVSWRSKKEGVGSSELSEIDSTPLSARSDLNIKRFVPASQSAGGDVSVFQPHPSSGGGTSSAGDGEA